MINTVLEKKKRNTKRKLHQHLYLKEKHNFLSQFTVASRAYTHTHTHTVEELLYIFYLSK
ncbi:hypothetical protein C0J52_06214 [Blattella germanica]|nr:hypothetical protein C0J52_06214 [Blattella germanica]